MIFAQEKMIFRYDRAADILYISKKPPYADPGSEEVGDDVIARLNPDTGDIEGIEVLFFSTRLLRSDIFEIPVTMKDTERKRCEARE